MTLKEASLRILDEAEKPLTYMEVYNRIVDNNLEIDSKGKTLDATISALLGNFIRNGDSRVKRVKQNGAFVYYLAKNEQNMNIDSILEDKEETNKSNSKKQSTTYQERDLHKLLSSYLKSINTYSKTIFHEQSNGKDNNQIWTHPDMVGIKFLNLQTKVSQNFLKSINRADTFKLSSYELKREINSDTQLKQAYFQAVSNSSWANYGYLVAFEFSDSLHEEMARLSKSFGIGIIELNANPYQSKILYPAIHKDLAFTTIDKLCKINKEFEKFIEQTEKLMNASDKYITGVEKEFEEFCDSCFANDTEAEEYCREHNIPFDESEKV